MARSVNVECILRLCGVVAVQRFGNNSMGGRKTASPDYTFFDGVGPKFVQVVCSQATVYGWLGAAIVPSGVNLHLV